MEERHNQMFITYEEGRATFDDYLNRVIFCQKRGFTPAEFTDFMFSLTTADVSMIELIKKLKVNYGLKIKRALVFIDKVKENNLPPIPLSITYLPVVGDRASKLRIPFQSNPKGTLLFINSR